MYQSIRPGCALLQRWMARLILPVSSSYHGASTTLFSRVSARPESIPTVQCPSEAPGWHWVLVAVLLIAAADCWQGLLLFLPDDRRVANSTVRDPVAGAAVLPSSPVRRVLRGLIWINLRCSPSLQVAGCILGAPADSGASIVAHVVNLSLIFVIGCLWARG
jgi:hypothetical protein